MDPSWLAFGQAMSSQRLAVAVAAWIHRLKPRRKVLSVEQRARDLIRAVDAGGLPLNAAIVNDIARGLGLEVSARAPMPETIERIRKALGRC